MILKAEQNCAKNYFRLGISIALCESGDSTYTPVEVELSNHFFHFLLRRAPERRRVKVVQLVESEQLWKVGEALVANSIDDLISLLDFVDNVVADFGVLPKTL